MPSVHGGSQIPYPDLSRKRLESFSDLPKRMAELEHPIPPHYDLLTVFTPEKRKDDY